LQKRLKNAQKTSKGIIILCYHRFRKRKAKKAEKDRPYVVSPAVFRRQMSVIKEEGFNVISMKKLVRFVNGAETRLPPKPLVITIDDGFSCTYTRAYPVLKEFKYPAVVYIYEDSIDGEKYYLTKEQVKEMAKNNIEPGCHTKSHPRLAEKREHYKDFLEREIVISRNNLEERFGKKMDTFSYPYGSYSPKLFPYLEKAGFSAAVTVENGINTKSTNRYKLKRYTVYSGRSLKWFRNLLKRTHI